MSSFKGSKMAADKVLKIGARLQFFPEAAPLGASSRVEDIKDNKFMAAMPSTDKGVPVIPQPGEHMLCKILGDGCFYRFFAKFLDKGMDGHLPVWYVSMPQEVEKVQNREHVRVQADFPVILRPLDEYGAMGDMIITRITDISGGGIGIVDDRELKLNSKVVLEMSNIPGVGMMRVTGQIVRCMPVKNAATPLYSIGIKFLDVSNVHQNRIIKFVFSVQRQVLAKGIGNK